MTPKVVLLIGVRTLCLLGMTSSCTPDTYCYYPAQRRIDHLSTVADSVFFFFPYASLKIIYHHDDEWVEDSVTAKRMAEFCNDYFVNAIPMKFKTGFPLLTQLQLDSL